jgi:hypothetical protein
MKCLEKSPAARYQSARHVADELQRFQSGEPVHARRGDAIYLTLRWLRKNVVVAGISGTAALLLLGLVTVTSLAYLAESQRRVLLEGRVEELESELAKSTTMSQSRGRSDYRTPRNVNETQHR